MKGSKHSMRTMVAGIMTALGLLSGCDSSPAGLDDMGEGAAVLIGSVGVASAGGAADPSGIMVSIPGQTASDITDAAGTFRIESVGASGGLTLRFRRGTMDVSVEVNGVVPGTLLRVAVTVSDTSATVDSTSASGLAEFEGEATFAGVAGATPNRLLVLTVRSDTGSVLVEVSENTTLFDADGDLTSFQSLLARAESGGQVRVEGDGSPVNGGLSATVIKAETDTDDDDDSDDHDDDDEDFEGYVTDLAVGGTAPSRTVSVTLLDDTAEVVVDIVEGTTIFDEDGDVHSIDALLAAFQSGTKLEIEGQGDLQSSGAFAATAIEVETDDNSDDDFEGKVSSLSVSTTPTGRIIRVTLVDDAESFTVDIVEGSTTFDSDGDFTTFDEVLAAYGSGQALKMDGEGVPAEDGVIVATEVEVETDD